jgi:uncharacterized repeat protein (TIGR01451 family)
VTFNKTVYASGPSQTRGTLTDIATLIGSSSLTETSSGTVNLETDAQVSLRIDKSIPATADLSTAPTFTFHVKNVAGDEVATHSLTFKAGGGTSLSTTVENLDPGTYTVTEDPLAGWVSDPSSKSVTINLPNCSGSVGFANAQIANPSIVTQAEPTTGTVGQNLTVSDTAAIGGGSNPTGLVNFGLYNSNLCTGSPVAGVSGDGPIDDNGVAKFSAPWTPGAVGTYYWRATYGGDGKHAAVSVCGGDGEQIVIGEAPTMTPTPTGTPATCLTPTPSVSVTPTFTVVPQATFTPTSTVVPQATATSTGTRQPPATSTRTPTPGGTGGGGGTRPNATGTATPSATSTATATRTLPPSGTPAPSVTATPTSTVSPPVVGGVGVVPVPTPGAHTPDQVAVDVIVIGELEQREAMRPSPPVPVPPPPVQLPPVADGIYNFVMTAFTGAQVTAPGEVNSCVPAEISITGSAQPSAALVGDPVNFTFTVTNPGTVPLTDVQVGSALPNGVDYVSANSQGAVNPATGYVEWAIEGGLAPGASIQFSVSATIAEPGEWTTQVCTAGQDALGNETTDCASVTVIGGVLTVTPTATTTITATPTVAATQGTPTPTVIATGTPTVLASATPTSTQAPATRTPTPQPIPTNTPVPAATNTPVPTATNMPVPTATNTPTT